MPNVECPFRDKPVVKYLGKWPVSLTSCPTCGRNENKDFPEKVRQIEEALTRACRADLKVAVMNCLSKDTKIITQDGLKLIQNVKNGERVLSHNGWRIVTNHFSREYEGELITIKPRGFPSFSVTPEHIFFVVRRPSNNRKLIGVCKVANQEPKPLWLEADQLSRGYILLYPIINVRKNLKEVSLGKVDRDLLTLAGFYLSEGSISYRKDHAYNIDFSFHIKEMPFYFELYCIIQKYGFKPHLYPRTKHKTVVLHCNSSVLADFLEGEMGRGAENKHIPDWMMTLPIKKQSTLLRALWRGDGYIGKVGNYWRATYGTISSMLAFQVHQLLLRQGIVSYVLYRKERTGHKASWSVQVSQKKSLERLAGLMLLDLRLGNSNQVEHLAIKDSWLYVPVYSVERNFYKGRVFNIEVANHTYSLLGGLTHNCIVNGLGECGDADIGVLFGKGRAAIYRRGEHIATVKSEDVVAKFMEVVRYLW